MISSGLKSAGEIFGVAEPRSRAHGSGTTISRSSPTSPSRGNTSTRSTSRSRVTVLTLLFASLAGYALARLRFAGAALVGLFLVSALMVPEEVTIIPNFFLMKLARAHRHRMCR